MPGVAIVGAGPSVLARGSFVTRGVVLHRPGDWMAVRRPYVFLTVEEGAWVEVCSSCFSGTMNSSRNPGPHSLKFDDWVGSLEVFVGDVGEAAVCVRLSPRFYLVSPLGGDPFLCGICEASEISAGPFVAGEPGFSSAGVRFARVPAWLLVRTLGAVDREWVVYFTFLMTPLDGADAWLGAGGEVGSSDRLIAVAMSRVRWRSVVPGIFRRGQGRRSTLASVTGDWLALGRDGLVLCCFGLVWTLRCPRNDPSGAKERGGWD